MKLRREREQVIAVPQAQIEAEAARQQKLARTNIYETELSLRSIREALRTCPQISESMSAFRIDSLRTPRRFQMRVKGARFTDGLVLLGTTQAMLEDRSHRLVIPDEGEVLYGRSPINVDPQALGSRPIELEGVEAIAGNALAVNALAYLAGAAAIESSYGWQHAFRADELAIVRNRITVSA